MTFRAKSYWLKKQFNQIIFFLGNLKIRGRPFISSASLVFNISIYYYRNSEIEASSLDQIKMTENWFEFDRKIFTTTNLIF